MCGYTAIAEDRRTCWLFSVTGYALLYLVEIGFSSLEFYSKTLSSFKCGKE